MGKEFVIQDYEFVVSEYKKYRLVDGVASVSYLQILIENSHEYLQPLNKNERRNAYI